MFGSDVMRFKCDCGQEEGYCPRKVRISGDGVLSQKAGNLLKCGKVKKQMKAMRKIPLNTPLRWPW